MSFAPTRDAGNRGNTYPPPLWLADTRVFQKDNLPAWDCSNTGAGGDGSVSSTPQPPPLGREACWVAPPLPGAAPGKIPQLKQATYSSK